MTFDVFLYHLKDTNAIKIMQPDVHRNVKYCFVWTLYLNLVSLWSRIKNDLIMINIMNISKCLHIILCLYIYIIYICI